MSQFIYLLNAMEDAASQSEPEKHGYRNKRRAVLEYVAKMEGKWNKAGDRCPQCGTGIAFVRPEETEF